MPQNRTILCPADEPQRIVALIRETIGNRGRVTISGNESSWASITLTRKGASLTLNRSVYKQNGDQFTKLRLGMYMHFDAVETKHLAIKDDLLQRIKKVQLAIGVVAEPEFVELAGHYECIFGLAEVLDAIIWTGAGVINAEGAMILDSEGNSEL
jgi:hypothetical protein